MEKKYFRLVDPTFEPADTVIDTDLADMSERMKKTLSASPFFNIILPFWANNKVKLTTACDALINLEFYLERVQNIEISGGDKVPTRFINPKEDIEELDLAEIKKVIFPYVDYYEKTGRSLTWEDLPYIWEYLLETYKKSFFPDKLSRFRSVFLFDSKENMADFKKEEHPCDLSAECECVLEETRTIEAHDMRWINNIPEDCRFAEFCEYAKSYWEGELTDVPIMEYLFSGKYRLQQI